MPLWGKTDANISKPKFLTNADKAKAVFVSAEEALLQTNKAKGIIGAGWWLLNEYTGSNGETRYKAEHLVAMTVANAVSGDAADDAKVSDVEVVITINTQPDPTAYYVDEAITLTVSASVTSGSLTYQWQKKGNTATAKWANISGATSASYTTPVLLQADDGTEYRVVLGSSSGAKKVTSEVAKAIYD
jgi:hypothetical protein